VKRALPCALAVAAALVVHTVAGHALAGHDVILALLTGQRWMTAALIAVLVAARLFLYLLAPGWALHVAAKILLERYRSTTRGGP
jgi:hypothetical protein